MQKSDGLKVLRRQFLRAGALGLAATGLNPFDAAGATPNHPNSSITAGAGKDAQGPFLPDPQALGKIEYVNPSAPAVEVPDYTGEYFEAVVPATLDLAERARLAAHAMTSMTNPNLDYEMYFPVAHMSQPPAMYVSQSDLDTW